MSPLTFPIGYKTESIGYENNCLLFRLESQEKAKHFIKEHLLYLKELVTALDLEEIRVGYGNKYFQVKSPSPPYNNNNRSIRHKMETLIQKYPYINHALLGGCNYDSIQRLIDEMASLNLPAFLVSMDIHRNLMVNEAGLKLMDSTPEELFSKSLAKLWVRPTELKPVSSKTYEIHLPPHLQEIHGLLKQQGELIKHHYYGWKVNGQETDTQWVRWTSDIKYRSLTKDIRGEINCRLMVCSGFDPVNY